MQCALCIIVDEVVDGAIIYYYFFLDHLFAVCLFGVATRSKIMA